MPVYLKQVLEHVLAMEGPDADRHRVSAIVRETIGAVGLLVNAQNDEVYDPVDRPRVVPRNDQNFRFRGGRRR